MNHTNSACIPIYFLLCCALQLYHSILTQPFYNSFQSNRNVQPMNENIALRLAYNMVFRHCQLSISIYLAIHLKDILFVLFDFCIYHSIKYKIMLLSIQASLLFFFVYFRFCTSTCISFFVLVVSEFPKFTLKILNLILTHNPSSLIVFLFIHILASLSLLHEQCFIYCFYFCSHFFDYSLASYQHKVPVLRTGKSLCLCAM